MSLPSGAFARVYGVGDRARSGELLVLRADSDEVQPRVGVVAGRKVGHAVQRNRAKRRMREAVRRTHLEPGTDYIVVALSDLSDLTFGAICADLGRAIEKNRMKTCFPADSEARR